MIRLERAALAPSPTLTSAAAAMALSSDADGAELANSTTSNVAWLSMRDALTAAQHNKCGWCESPLDERAIEIDHIRPKKRTMYWWLAFELENILAACRSCNNLKLDQWPLVTGGAPLVPKQRRSTTSESATVIDPTWEDPAPHLSFVFELGEWHYLGNGPRGAATVDVLQLRRDGLRRKLNHHARVGLDPWIVDAQDAMRTDDRAAFERAVSILGQRCQPTEPYAAFSRYVTRLGLVGAYSPRL